MHLILCLFYGRVENTCLLCGKAACTKAIAAQPQQKIVFVDSIDTIIMTQNDTGGSIAGLIIIILLILLVVYKSRKYPVPTLEGFRKQSTEVG